MEGIFVRPLIFVLAAFTLDAEPRRIVSTSPSITETLFALGAGDRVVGVSNYCHFPPEAMTRPRIGSYLRPNAEVIARLQPDLVIIQRLPNNLSSSLRQLGLTVAEVDTGDLVKNIAVIHEIGRAAELHAAAEKLVSRVRADLDSIRAAYAAKPRRSVFFVVGRTPGRLEGIVAVGAGSYLNELIEIAGGRNVLASGSLPYPKISLETVVRLQPDVIIDMGEMADTTNVTAERKSAVERLWTGRREIRARVYAVASDIYVVPGPRMVDAAREIARMLHPEPPR
jgi:iron complex transport system substrate-binding protein